jgi:pseudaminic acid biosynthesis-associated methylase
MEQTEQSKKWAADFGKDYTDRNPKNIDDMDKLYLGYFNTTRSALNKEFLDFLPRDISILEVGSNCGAQLSGLQKMGFTNLTGIEISRYALEQAKKSTENIDFVKASALDIPFKDKSFDLVFTSGVLIHIHPNDLKKVINEMYRVSKKFIWCFEYFSENCIEIEYRGNKNLLWKNHFLNLFLKEHPNLRILKEKKYKYLNSDNQDIAFLLEKI